MSAVQKMLKQAVTAEFASDSVTYRNDYSGRGMYGDSCVGLVGSETDVMMIVSEVVSRLINEVFDAAISADIDEDNSTDAAHVTLDNALKMQQALLTGMQRDSMGYDVIVYWPDLAPLSDLEMIPSDDELSTMLTEDLHQWVCENDEDIDTDEAIEAWGTKSRYELEQHALNLRKQLVAS